MARRPVRLEDQAEAASREVREATGLPISKALKQQVREASRHHPYALYERLDLGPGGYAIASSTDTRRGVKAALRQKLRK